MPAGYLACMLAVATHYRLPPRILPSIQVVEGGGPGVVHRNVDGSVDMGVMQINTRWILPLAQVARLAPSDVARRLVLQPCFNIAAAGLILRQALDRDHGDMMRAIGDYHSQTPALNLAYRVRVWQAAEALFVPQGRGVAYAPMARGVTYAPMARRVAYVPQVGGMANLPQVRQAAMVSRVPVVRERRDDGLPPLAVVRSVGSGLGGSGLGGPGLGVKDVGRKDG